MASINHFSAFLLIALSLFAVANPLAAAITILPGVSVTGQLCCNTTGNCPGQSVSGAVVSLNCTNLIGATVTLGQNTTDVNGRFNITVPNVLGLLLTNGPLLGCAAVVQLPLNQTLCPILSTVNGTLVGVLQIVGTLLTQVLGLVLNLRVAGFVNVAT